MTPCMPAPGEMPEKELAEGPLVDHLQRRVRSHRLEGVRIDVRTAIHTGSPVFLKQAKSDQPVYGRAADARMSSSVVDRHQFCQVDQILAARATSSLHHCDMGTTRLSHYHYAHAPWLIHH